jgi:hypothetical protein
VGVVAHRRNGIPSSKRASWLFSHRSEAFDQP